MGYLPPAGPLVGLSVPRVGPPRQAPTARSLGHADEILITGSIVGILPVVRLDGPAIHPSILAPLLTMALAFTLLAAIRLLL